MSSLLDVAFANWSKHITERGFDATFLSLLRAAVATDVAGTLCHRDHRGPGDRPVARGRTTPGLAPGGGVIGPRSAAAG